MAIDINIGSKLDAKGFKQADTAINKLTKSSKNLSKTFARTLGTAAVLAFGKASIKAFAEDDKAATSLGQTLKNLNLAYGSNIDTVNGYISRLETQTGVLDDELRPAMDRLLRATGDVAKSQEMLNLALDIAAGTGKSVTQVSQSLQKAYLGQTQAIGRLGVGLTKADIASSSFEEIQRKLTALFAGQATAAAETFAGQLDKLTIAANNAKETIGRGLYDAITSLSGGGATAATDNIDKLATGIADTLKNAGQLIDKLDKIKPVLIAFGIAAGAAFLPMTTAIAGAIFLLGDLNKRLNEQSFRKGIIPEGLGNISMTVSGKVDNSAAKTAQTAQTKAAKDTAKAQKDSLKLAKARAVFDLQKIQIEAALKGKISEEDAIRLKLMKAIEEENLTNIEKYQKALTVAQEKTKELNTLLSTIKLMEIKDPFDLWKIDPVTASINELTKSMFSVQTQIQASGKEWSSFASTVGTTVIKPNLSEWNSSFGAAGSAASAAAAAALKAQQDALAAQTKAATDALNAGSKEQQDALAAQLKAQQEALTAQSAAQLAALKARLAEEAAAYKELADATQAAAEAQFVLGTNDSATRNAGVLAQQAAAQAAAAAAALAAAEQAAAAATTSTGGSKIEITVNTGVGDPNAIAEAIAEVLRGAGQRGTLDVAGFE